MIIQGLKLQEDEKHDDDSVGRSALAETLQDVGTLQLLDLDTRPTFVLDLTPEGPSWERYPRLVYSNASLDNSPALKDILAAAFPETAALNRTGNEFTKWATAPQLGHSCSDPSFAYLNHTWTALTAKQRWRVINGCQDPSRRAMPRAQRRWSGVASEYSQDVTDSVFSLEASASAGELESISDRSSALVPSFDWRRALVRNGISPHIQVFLEADWASTPLGPMSSWSPQLQLLTYLVMIDPNPAVLLWGEELTLIYNEACIHIVGEEKYPGVVGSTFAGTFPEIFAVPEMKRFYEGIYARGRLTGQTTKLESQKHFLASADGLEERYFCYSFFPIEDGSGSVAGFYEPCYENTKQVLLKSRIDTVRKVEG